jgi:hypothetical protein
VKETVLVRISAPLLFALAACAPAPAPVTAVIVAATVPEDPGPCRKAPLKADPLAVLRALPGDRIGYAVHPAGASSPWVEMLGADAKGAGPFCRIGVWSFPFDLCRDRLEAPGMLSSVLAGEEYERP